VKKCHRHAQTINMTIPINPYAGNGGNTLPGWLLQNLTWVSAECDRCFCYLFTD